MGYKEKFEDFLDKMQGLLDNAKKQGHILVRVEDLERTFPELREEDNKEKPNGGIVMEDFNEGNGFYKVNLNYLNKEQVEEIEGLVKKWNPELKENKDERIRKDIISYIQLANQFIPQFQKDKWLSWLEKQGEQAKIEALRTEYEKGRADAIAELKQKPFDYSNANIQQKDFAMPPHSQRKSLQQVLNDFKNDFDYFVRYAENYIAEQKLTEWNEDGEKIRKEIMDFIDINTIVSDERRNRWFSYLEKQGEQKPAEEYNITGIGSKNAQGKLGEMIKNLKHDNKTFVAVEETATATRVK